MDDHAMRKELEIVLFGLILIVIICLAPTIYIVLHGDRTILQLQKYSGDYPVDFYKLIPSAFLCFLSFFILLIPFRNEFYSAAIFFIGKIKIFYVKERKVYIRKPNKPSFLSIKHRKFYLNNFDLNIWKNKISLFSKKGFLYYKVDHMLLIETMRLIKFWIIGGTGMILSLCLLFIFTEFCGFYYMLSAIVTSLIVIAYNYLANHFWSFSDRNDISLTAGFGKFILVMLMYFIVYQPILYVFTEFVFKDWSFYFVKDYMISSMVATILATIPKYIVCFLWIWKK